MKWEKIIPLVIVGGVAVWLLLQVVPPTPPVPPPKEEAEITTIEVEKV